MAISIKDKCGGILSRYKHTPTLSIKKVQFL